jgi:hypothetical protein
VTPNSPSQVLDRSGGGGLADVVELILDKGLVIDAFARVSVIGIEICTVEVRVVVASIDTYLRYADAMRQLAMAPKRPGVLDAVTDKIGEIVSGDRPLRAPRGTR